MPILSKVALAIKNEILKAKSGHIDEFPKADGVDNIRNLFTFLLAPFETLV
jgi:hypothetical protein